MVVLPPGVGCWRWSWWRRWASAPVLRGSVCLRGGGALWHVLRGLWAVLWLVRYLCSGRGVGGSTGILQRFRGVRWCWWCSPGVCGSWASAGRCDALRGWSWVLALSSFHGAVMGFYGVSCGRWWTFSRALVLGVGLALGRCSSAVVAFLGF